MRLVLDGTVTECVEEREILRKIDYYVGQLSSVDKVVSECFIDGHAVDIAQLSGLISSYIEQDEVFEVVLTSTSRINLVGQVIESLLQYLDQLESFIENAVAHIQANNSIQGIEWDLFYQGLEWVSQASVLLLEQEDLLGQSPARVGRTLSEFNPILEEMASSLERRDIIFLSDLLEYEFGGKLGELKAELASRLIFLGNRNGTND